MTRSDTKNADAEADADADADAVARCAAGDRHAFEALYARHGGACLMLARQILLDVNSAEEAVQEAFLHLWHDPGAFDGSRSSTRTWLVVLTRSRAIDRVRDEQRRTDAVLGADRDPADERPGPDAHAISAALGPRIAAALAVLTAAQREALVLAYWGGYTQQEIAALTGTPLGTVKTSMRAALVGLSLHAVPEGGRPAVSRS